MLTNEEKKKWLLENCLDENGNLDLSGLDFSDFNGNVDISWLKVKKSLDQSNQIVEGHLNQNCQNVDGNLYQNLQCVGGILIPDQKTKKEIRLEKRLRKQLKKNRD